MIKLDFLRKLITKNIEVVMDNSLRKAIKNYELGKTILKYCKLSTISLVLLLLIPGYFLFIHKSAPMPEEKIVEVETVGLKNIRKTTKFIGTIRAQQATSLIAKNNGILNRIVVSGQQVKKGDLIARIMNEDVEKNLKLSKEDEQITKQQFERAIQLLKSGISSNNMVEEKKKAWIDAQKKLAAANTDLDNISFYAPFDGIVGVFKVREGSQLSAGVEIVNIYNPLTLITEFYVPSSIVHEVQDKALCIIGDKNYELTYIQRMIDEETHMCPAYVNIECAECIVGESIDVELILKDKQSVIVIPNEAVFLRNGITNVYVVKDGKAVLTPVEIGTQEKESIEILSGLTIGELIIITGQARLYPDILVKIHNVSLDKVLEKK